MSFPFVIFDFMKFLQMVTVCIMHWRISCLAVPKILRRQKYFFNWCLLSACSLFESQKKLLFQQCFSSLQEKTSDEKLHLTFELTRKTFFHFLLGRTARLQRRLNLKSIAGRLRTCVKKVVSGVVNLRFKIIACIFKYNSYAANLHRFFRIHRKYAFLFLLSFL